MDKKQIRKHLENYIGQASFISASMAKLIDQLEKKPPEGYRIWELQLLDAQDSIADAIERLDTIDQLLGREEDE